MYVNAVGVFFSGLGEINVCQVHCTFCTFMALQQRAEITLKTLEALTRMDGVRIWSHAHLLMGDSQFNLIVLYLNLHTTRSQITLPRCVLLEMQLPLSLSLYPAWLHVHDNKRVENKFTASSYRYAKPLNDLAVRPMFWTKFKPSLTSQSVTKQNVLGWHFCSGLYKNGCVVIDELKML
jgi:hypothetical protein